ncbi:MAG: AAA family ATPase, partial [Spirochaetota bacterium]
TRPAREITDWTAPAGRGIVRERDMISSLTFHSGYPIKLRGIGTRRIELNPRLNVLYGPNGSGKSTILRALATATGCASGGWSLDPDAVGYDPGGEAWTNERSVEIAPPPFAATVKWDGLPVFFQDCYANSEESFLGGDYLDRHAHLRSTGEKRIGLVNELINFIEDRFPTYRLPRAARPTILLDEVDNHIGAAAQSVFWEEIVAELCKKYQLVISSHSLFPILLQRNNSLRQDTVLVLEPGYDEICLTQLGLAIDYYNRQG